MRMTKRSLVFFLSVLCLGALPFLLPGTVSADPPTYVSEWGSYGSGAGQFKTVRDVCVDTDGYVYVLDYGNCRVQKFTWDGVFVTEWGSCGYGTGELYQPHGLGIDQSGFLYVADSYNHRIVKFTLDGTYVATWGGHQSGDPGYFNGPRDVAVDSEGYVYVADTFNDRIQKLTKTGSFVAQWNGSSGAGGTLDRPVSVDVGVDGNLYVLDYGNYQIQKFSLSGFYLDSWGQIGSGAGEMGVAHGLGAGPGGRIYLADSQNNRIQVFTEYGLFLDEFGALGTGPGEFNDPRDVTANADTLLYVADTNNDRVQLFEVSGSVPPPPPNTLSIGDGQGISGGLPVDVRVELTLDSPVLAMEFKVQDLPDWLSCVSATASGRASDMTADFTDGGMTHVLVYDAAAGVIPAGSGLILELAFEVEPSAVLGDSVDLDLIDVIIADDEGAEVSVSVDGGVFRIERLLGDINGDNLVDVGDLVRLTEIILGTGDPPSPEELAAADCNGDTNVNALDVACLLNSILGGAASPSTLMLAAAEPALTDIRISAECDVRGLQLVFPAGASVDVAGVDLFPFDLHEGVTTDGMRCVLAYDPAGGVWESGREAVLSGSTAPIEVRAYGVGGHPLEVTSTGGSVTIGMAPVTAGIRALPPQPNPFRAQTKIRFTTGTRGPAKVSVYSITGALVSTMPERVVEAGPHAWTWNAIDRRGRALPAGLYIAVVEAPDGRSSVRLTHLGP